MKHFWQLSLLLCILLFASGIAQANTIDSLSTKQDILKFLTDNLSNKGIFLLDEPTMLFRPERKQIYAFADDTVQAKDEFTGKTFTQIIPHDPNSYKNSADTSPLSGLFPPSDALEIMDQYPFHFYKADIDNNGYTDLIVDAGLVIVVMDMGTNIEAHTFSPSAVWNSYSFKNFLSLPGGTCALLLRHDHNPCGPRSHASPPKAVTFITHILPNDAVISSTTRIDTLYKITTGIDTETRGMPGSNSYKQIAVNYADTVDMHLYNAIDTIVYKFHGFANYNRHYKTPDISKLIYCAGCCGDVYLDIAECIEIKRNGECLLTYSDRNHTFSGSLDSNRLKELWNYISYIDIRSKKDNYICEVDHSSGGTLLIYFEDGTYKMIGMSGQHPPFEIGYLCKQLSDICKKQTWLYSQKRSDIKFPEGSKSSTDANYNECNCYY
jgi:hypothetical protein